jgi:hypothetical protein
LAWWLRIGFAVLLTSAVRADDSAARALLVEAILSTNVKEQVELIGKLEATESDLVPEVLNAWREGTIFLHQAPDGTKIPFLRKDGKAVRIDDGNPIEASETTPAETTAKVRRAMKSTLDVLSIAGADPQARRAAVTKLGMTQNPAYLPIFEARLASEKDPSVVASCMRR